MYAQLVLLVVLSYILSSAWTWRQNFKVLSRSGARVVTAPVYIGSPLWMVLSKLAVPFFEMLPRTWTQTWIDIISPNWAYLSTTKPFDREGDVIMVASPGGTYMTTNNAELITQICARRNDFPKPEKNYKVIEVFGRSVLTTEGSTWRVHRKTTAPAFSEELHGLVWTETLRQVDQMIECWHGRPGNSSDQMSVPDLGHETTALTLHIISKAGFGVSLSWPGQESQDEATDVFSSEEIPKGHSLTFRNALEGTLVNFLWFVIFSPGILRALPFQTSRKAYQSYANFDIYLKELLESKRSTATPVRSKDLMARLLDASNAGDGESKSANGKITSGSLSDTDITGNAFVFLVAGHETTSLSILYSCLFLAINRPAQRKLQAEIDAILNEKPIQQCHYEKYHDRLATSMVGAVINEQLRLLPPVILLPKVVATSDQTVTVDGRQILVPKDTFIHLPSPPLHRNPRYWPYEPSVRTGKSHDLDDFRPERWFVRDNKKASSSSREFTTRDVKDDTNHASSQSHALYNPPQGAFIPFSEGQRGCLGRRFALVEMTAALTSLFSRYSVELGTEEWAAEERVGQMTATEREELYGKAVKKAWHTLETGASARLTLQLDKGKEIPVRFVRRGRERFG